MQSLPDLKAAFLHQWAALVTIKLQAEDVKALGWETFCFLIQLSTWPSSFFKKANAELLKMDMREKITRQSKEEEWPS